MFVDLTSYGTVGEAFSPANMYLDSEHIKWHKNAERVGWIEKERGLFMLDELIPVM